MGPWWRMDIRDILLKIFTVIGFLLVTIIAINIEEVIRKHGWDQLLSRLGDTALVSDISQLPHHWIWLAATFFIGGAIALWLVVYLPSVKIIRPDIPTSVHLQFTAGSNQVRQLANENVSNTLSERALFNFYGEDGKLLDQRVLWYVFVTFNKPIHYGQVIVDAGNATIPAWQVVSHVDTSAIIRFDGDIGNVALTIKTISPNPQ